MLILTIRTDKPKAEIGLFDDSKRLAYSDWQAHRELAETIHQKIKEILETESKTFKDLQGIVIFKGPGSFTGLRIGFSVANALADSIKIPIVTTADHDWLETGLKQLQAGKNETIVQPEYGAPARTTTQKK